MLYFFPVYILTQNFEQIENILNQYPVKPH